MELLRSEAESCDWLLRDPVFYHVDDATAVAIISELGKTAQSRVVMLDRWLERFHAGHAARARGS